MKENKKGKKRSQGLFKKGPECQYVFRHFSINTSGERQFPTFFLSFSFLNWHCSGTLKSSPLQRVLAKEAIPGMQTNGQKKLSLSAHQAIKAQGKYMQNKPSRREVMAWRFYFKICKIVL